MRYGVKKCLLILFVFAVLIFSYPVYAYETGDSFSLTMLDVGEGLSVLIRSDGKYMLYDGGGRDASSYVVSSLAARGIEELDYMVASHYDEDHISGLVGVLHTTQVDQAIVPGYTAGTAIYQSFEEALSANTENRTCPQPGDIFSLGSAQCEVLSPASWDNEYENNNSIVIRITYGDFSCLLTGDAEMEAEDVMISSGMTLDSDLLVVGHHGSAYSTTDKFLNAVSPAYAFISVGEGNSYGLPSEQVMTSLKAYGVEMWRTDKQGETTVFSDGSGIWFSSDPCTDWSDGGDMPENSRTETHETDEAADTDSPAGITYILNTNTMKFHYPDCPSADRISSRNRQESTKGRDELIAEGYSPCGNCRP